jgi:hypothetical protein
MSISRKALSRGLKGDITYPSLVEPPDGYVMLRNELLQMADVNDYVEEKGIFSNEFDFLDDCIIFRGIVQCPNGDIKYVSSVIDSKVVLCKKFYWKDFWQQVVRSDKPKRSKKK